MWSRLTVLVIALLSASTSALALPLRTDWSEVEAVEQGKRIMVRLYEDAAPPADRAIKGRFVFATDSGISLVGREGDRLTFKRGDVRRVAVKRPTRKRAIAALIVTAAGVAISLPLAVNLAGSDHVSSPFVAYNSLTTMPAALTTRFAVPRRVIYNVPSKHRQP